MSYSDDQTFNLEAVGAPELWVTYSRPGLLPYAEGEAFMRQNKLFNTKRLTVDNVQTMEDFLNDSNAEFEWVLRLIEGWNLIYSKKHEKAGEILPIPKSEEGIWKQIPGLYMAHIVATIKRDPTGSDFLANGITTLNNSSIPLQEEVPLEESTFNG